ncbi:MAG: integrase family protein [Myxococcaceae bacterium]|nr:integrase family protein [Myxococcaceae bacterium]
MSSIYKRGERYYIRFRDADGRWISKVGGSTKEEAKKILRDVEKGLKDLPRVAKPSAPPVPKFSTFVAPWIKRRRALGLRNVDDNLSTLNRHVVPVLGDMLVTEIRVRHVRDLMDGLRASELAPRTVRHVYGTLHKMFADLVVDEVIPHTPCVLTKDQLPKLRDKHPEWRSTAIFTREEAELLLSADAVPEDRRVLNALFFLTGVRFGEAAGLRWRDLDERLEPLPRFTVARSYEHGTKTETPRTVPVHPLLHEVLREWRSEGFARLMGRNPEASDLVVPSREGEMRSRHQARNTFLGDLGRLGLRHRRVHDTRRTFITLARVDGARRDVLEQITHGARGNIVDAYTTLPWPTLCEAVAVVRLRRLSPDEVRARIEALATPAGEAQNGEAPGKSEAPLVTNLVTASERRGSFVQKSWERHANLGGRGGGGAGSRTRVRKCSTMTSTRHSR